MNIAVSLNDGVSLRDDIVLDWPRDLPLPRVGEHITFHFEEALVAKVVGLSWDVSNENFYPTLALSATVG